MGWFSNLFGGGSGETVETRLLHQYTEIYANIMGMSWREAKENATNLLTKAKQEVARRGWTNQGTNTGDELLRKVKTEERIRESMEVVRAEGVREEDVRWWWNMPPLERVVIELLDEQHRMAAFITALEQGSSPEEAATRTKKIHPIYGDPRGQTGDDKPLPIELKRRITSFIEKHYSTPELMRKRVEGATSFNALIREEIRKGNL